jgi:hypothetical protein
MRNALIWADCARNFDKKLFFLHENPKSVKQTCKNCGAKSHASASDWAKRKKRNARSGVGGSNLAWRNAKASYNQISLTNSNSGILEKC